MMESGSEWLRDRGAPAASGRALAQELDWLRRVLDTRITLYFEQPCPVASVLEVEPPDLGSDESPYATLLRRHRMTFEERLVLILSLAPEIQPQALDVLLIRNKNLDRVFSEFGGRAGGAQGGFRPTLETAAFVLAGDDLNRRFEVSHLFGRDHFFLREGMLQLGPPGDGEPFFAASLSVTPETLAFVTRGDTQKPDYHIGFPAKLTTTELTWDDLVLAGDVMAEVEKVTAWLKHSRTVLDDWGLSRTLKPGYRSLFYGPPGTGKTLTATLIGAEMGADVYRIDLSMIVSKYIGETEKNLARVFDLAENKRWVLFFDEADALFGRRTQTANAHDRYANQEVSFLLQRVDDYPGLVILATNLKGNLDDAFARRFQSIIYFPMPDAELRLRLWKTILGDGCRLADDADLSSLSEAHELSGGAITNAVRYAAVNALQHGRERVGQDDLLAGVRHELRKEGRSL